jgi:hypothetical protein
MIVVQWSTTVLFSETTPLNSPSLIGNVHDGPPPQLIKLKTLGRSFNRSVVLFFWSATGTQLPGTSIGEAYTLPPPVYEPWPAEPDLVNSPVAIMFPVELMSIMLPMVISPKTINNAPLPRIKSAA